MPVSLYNTLTRRVEPLETRDAGRVAMYVCGVTPYDYPHMGNARAVAAFDTVRRYLEYRGYTVYYVQNFTDVDDKIIARAAEAGTDWQALAGRFTTVYFEEMDALNVKRATRYPKATEHMGEIISLVERLEEQGLAYRGEDGVYFAVRKFAGYGRLSGRNIDEMESGARVEVSDDKRDPLDFALWKAAKPGEPSWESPWGPGRPGWHIECSAMSEKHLGAGFDIHGGGQDLIFPHHENEIAQSEGAGGEGCLARYWMHNGFVTINREKMSKSLGNFFTVREVLERYPAPVVRYFLTSAHYRSPLDFSDAALDQAKAAYGRLRTAVMGMSRAAATAGSGDGVSVAAAVAERLATAEDDFREAMDDDFSTPRALAVLFDLAAEGNRAVAAGNVSSADCEVLNAARETLVRLSAVLGIVLCTEMGGDELTPKLMELLIALRSEARSARNFGLADAIRARLAEIGVLLEDSAQGTEWRRK